MSALKVINIYIFDDKNQKMLMSIREKIINLNNDKKWMSKNKWK